MAEQLQLVLRDDLTSGTTYVTGPYLRGGTSGFALAPNGWSQAVTGYDGEHVMETFTLTVKGSSHNDLALKFASLEAYVRYCKERDRGQPVQSHQAWIMTKMNNEVGTRYCKVYSLRFPTTVPLFSKLTTGQSYVSSFPVVIERAPYWEIPSWDLVLTNINCVGGKANSSGDTLSQLPPRIGKAVFAAHSALSVPISEGWFGFQPSSLSAPANFVAFWDAELGVYGENCSLMTTPSAHNGNAVYCTFNNPALVDRIRLRVVDVTTNYADQRGKFDVILRARPSPYFSGRVRLVSWYYTSYLQYFDPVTIPVPPSSQWFMYPLGRIELPFGGGAEYTSVPLQKEQGFVIQAQRTSAIGELDFDGVTLVPVLGGFAHFRGGPLSYGIDTNLIWTTPDDDIGGNNVGPTRGNALLDISGTTPRTWMMPNEACAAVFCGHSNIYGSSINDSIDVTLSLVDRYHIMRWAVL